MTVDEELHALIGRLPELGRVRLNRGPRNPAAPDPDLAAPVAAYLAAHPAARRDPGYVAFLECYAGAFVTRPREWFSLTLLGIGVDPEVDLRTPYAMPDPSFDPFADVHFKIAPEAPGPEPWAFAFARDERTGVFAGHGYTSETEPPGYTWLCDTFLEWLRLIIDTRGFLSPPPSGR